VTVAADPPARPAPAAAPTLSMKEFVGLMAMLSAVVAFSIDSMLPALPEIGRDLASASPNAAQLVIVAFVFGMGAGTLFAGPLSDALGRRRVILGGFAIYAGAALWAMLTTSLEWLLVARVAQGIGAAGPRVAAQAMVRDLYMGRGMAKVSSFIMMTFTLVPAVAPLMGAGIIALSGWRGVFGSFVLFAALAGFWLLLRQPETLPLARRRPLEAGRLWLAVREVLGHPNVRRAIAVQTLIFGVLFSTLTSVQPIYDVTFDKAGSFPLWFGLVALLSGGASFLNARLVERLGMLWLLRRALGCHLVLSVLLALSWAGLPEGARFPAFLVWQVGSFALAGLTIGNLVAIAMQPMGHIAGMASSVISAVSTVLAVVVAAPIGLLFDGTPVPLASGVALAGGLALLVSLGLREEA
jgi:DHA1 family bicyclomycin/chloramphenicol resistance-like MFS transporter